MFTHTKLKVYFEGAFVDFDNAKISIANTGFLYGLAIFSGVRAHWNKDKKQLYIFRPEDHYKRLVNASKVCRFTTFLETISYEKFLKIIKEILTINDIHEDAYIRPGVYIDEVKIGPRFSNYKDSFSAFLYPIGDYVPIKGMKVMVSSWRRIEDTAIPARLKLNGAYLNTAFAKTEALDNGFEEALVMDSLGHVVEGSAENFFIVRNGILITPPVYDNILEGITRDSIIQLAKDNNIPFIERSIDRTELYCADEVFLTGTGAQVAPVIEIDRVKIGNGKIGPISEKFQKLYHDAVRGTITQYRLWLAPVY